MKSDEPTESSAQKNLPKDDQEIVKVLEQSLYTVSALRKILEFTQNKLIAINKRIDKEDNKNTNDMHLSK